MKTVIFLHGYNKICRNFNKIPINICIFYPTTKSMI